MNKWMLISQSTKKNDFDEHLVLEGTYQECLKEMKNIEKGYICKDVDENTVRIVKTKGWK